MRITLCSTDIIWEDKMANMSLLESIFAKLSFNTDLIILPEMFATGFTMNSSVAENINGETISWMKAISKRYNCAIIGSIPFIIGNNNLSDHKCTNRAFFVMPDGSFEYYDKRHLFRMGEENNHYVGGNKRCVVEYMGVRFCLNICYDIRFPVWSRNINNDYDVLVNIANFPESRVSVIKPLVQARAIENQSYALFVNRIGSDKECKYIPSSLAVDFKGNIIGERYHNPEIKKLMPEIEIINLEINLDSLNQFRAKFPAWMDRDSFTIN